MKNFLFLFCFFFKILASLENVARSLPKLQRSVSEPNLQRTIQSDDLFYICASPKTPVHNRGFDIFSFYAPQTLGQAVAALAE